MNHHSPRVLALAQRISAATGYPCTANLYLTPPNAQGFGLHYDTHSTFIVHLFGDKEWTLYRGDANYTRQQAWRETDIRHRHLVWQPFQSDKSLLNVTRKLIESLPPPQVLQLGVGSVLHIPSGMIHAARTARNPCADRGERTLLTDEHVERLIRSGDRATGFAPAPPIGSAMHLTFGIETDTPFTVAGLLHLVFAELKDQHPIFQTQVPLHHCWPAGAKAADSPAQHPWMWHHALQLALLDASLRPENWLLRSTIAYFPTALRPPTGSELRWRWVELDHVRDKIARGLDAVVAGASVARAFSLREDAPVGREKRSEIAGQRRALNCPELSSNLHLHWAQWNAMSLPPVPKNHGVRFQQSVELLSASDTASACSGSLRKTLLDTIEFLSHSLKAKPPGVKETPSLSAIALRRAAWTMERLADTSLTASLAQQRADSRKVAHLSESGRRVQAPKEDL
jgi:hypothetical protein